MPFMSHSHQGQNMKCDGSWSEPITTLKAGGYWMYWKGLRVQFLVGQRTSELDYINLSFQRF